MTITLNKFLINKGYCSVKLIFLKTKHYLIECKVNGEEGKFILDSGASNSCVCNSLEKKFKLETKENTIKASSATSEMTNTNLSKKNEIQIGKWSDKLNLITFDMNHINKTLSEKGIDSIDGIVGADVLKKSNAILDYNKNKLYLKL
jgi:hypothetical protein